MNECHVTDRGNHRKAVFFNHEDRERCRTDFAKGARRHALDDLSFPDGLERRIGRIPRPRNRGPKPKPKEL